MATDRSADVIIGGETYELILTTKATKEIAARYGGLDNLGDKLLKAENFEMALGEIVWLVTVLANQSILIHNLKDRDHPKELAQYKEALTEALFKGTRRSIVSEEDQKNPEVG